MVTLLIHRRVADYDAWRPVYDRVTSGPMGERVRSHQIPARNRRPAIRRVGVVNYLLSGVARFGHGQKGD